MMMNKTVNRAGFTRRDKQNMLVAQTGEDKYNIHMRGGSTGGNNQQSGETPDR